MKIKAILLCILAFMPVLLASCWNYREVNEMAIVIGAAVDKGKTKNYMLTVEVLDVGGGAETQVNTKVLSIEGETVFDAVRRLISVEGKRGYWGHTQVLIVSEEIARTDISEVINFFRQDAETRADLYVIVAKGCSAKEILNAGIPLGDAISDSLAKSLENSIFLSESPETRLYTLIQALKSDKTAPVLPAVTLMNTDDKNMPVFCGTAVFKKSRLIDYLDVEETKAMLFLKNEIEGGILVTRTDSARISHEILGNNTKTGIKSGKERILFDISVKTRTAIDEVTGSVEFSNPDVLDEIKKLSESQLKGRLLDVIDRARQLRADIFGFGQKLYENNPEKWNEISGNYDSEFANIQVNLSVEIEIANTSIIYKQAD